MKRAAEKLITATMHYFFTYGYGPCTCVVCQAQPTQRFEIRPLPSYPETPPSLSGTCQSPALALFNAKDPS